MPDGVRPVRLEIQIDFDDIHFVHFTASGSLVLTYSDLPKPLQNRIRGILHGLQQRRIEHIDFHSGRTHQAFAGTHPFDLRFLREEEDFEELFGLILWWIHRNSRQRVCRKDIYDLQPHKTWTCECGEVVAADKELCTNERCPSWTKLAMCTGDKKAKKLRLA
ncbi:hypothetical protein A3C09_01405 [Candidatus Uhrbacteria bacterium RIFCSPHIGHO2_02_FULL_47_44]|uniref:Uncharacterized protein n=1 Tax=Candidatus Uhrbacteria bacterium RIFCSPLOWO2_02_FULL_48_18 TaxID=1802408 RepID=A0A1F7V8X2_9BACT|nr:MAG: hypothetical protein A3C09_01405 [Candidatus Uhrbacteria bacterium RIFCSPHIGHO2_02_FULL_47_44]OGL77442.1 MAG: hypothetical protein A3E97_00460 [Candidatus Uhrbacteria bacterium RIFCSPHIGHO2_12_FULL_47_12]OGL81803.1 MAG: hypothetical protein A3B20_01770 [Candidatus Uhrbacteria bacterium RIFCSPLOWO2_01_FULL_47_17]OGL86966.1 MAG: hypothetical protein A3I41_03360 [Candidatus Uhrbacteria bacterium RIFCSPLOWO2_02_FULL_48_18]OGL94366.1 MAG: hypothetical protein A3H12_05215 [Candidatus Uhrbacte